MARHLILFVSNGWWYRAMSGGDLHVIEVASRWARRLPVEIAMPAWAYRHHADRLGNVALVSSGLFEKSPPRSLAGASVRYLIRSATNLGTRPALVVAGSHYPYDLLPAWTISRRRNVPLIVYLFHLASTFRKTGLRAAAVARWEKVAIRLIRNASLVLADNDGVVEELLRLGIARERIQRTWNASTDVPAGIDEERTANEVVYCHGLSDTKGWQDLVLIGQRLRDRKPGAILRVLGDGPRRKELERQVAEAHLEGVVRVEGYVDEETKWRALQRAAVFIAPSREEGWGIAVGEAIQAGAPVVAYDLAVFREVHGEKAVHLVPIGEPSSFADAVVDMLKTAALPAAELSQTAVPERTSRTWDQIAQLELDLVIPLARRMEPAVPVSGVATAREDVVPDFPAVKPTGDR
jgi:glycosyltransferase involved in cell wall biosynthesis